MAGLRAFSFELPASGELLLGADESHHLVRVRRAREGDPVEVINANGRRAATRLLHADGRAARLRIESLTEEPPAPWHLTLAQALPKGKTMDAVVQRATELGVDRIVPLFTARSEVDLAPQRAQQKQQKWQQTALESAKQCGNPWLPGIAEPVPLETFLPSVGDSCKRLVAALTPDAQTVTSALGSATHGPQVVVLIGPEGDFSPAEYRLIFDHGFTAVSLGPRVLRVETAACALLALTLATLRSESKPAQ